MINPDIYKVAFHKSHEILILADCDFRVLDANETAQQLLNYRPEEIKNREIQELFLNPIRESNSQKISVRETTLLIGSIN